MNDKVFFDLTLTWWTEAVKIHDCDPSDTSKLKCPLYEFTATSRFWLFVPPLSVSSSFSFCDWFQVVCCLISLLCKINPCYRRKKSFDTCRFIYFCGDFLCDPKISAFLKVKLLVKLLVWVFRLRFSWQKCSRPGALTLCK